ncbi:MAG: methyltransferase domain-containing protein, partial [Halobacteriota archaeon]
VGEDDPFSAREAEVAADGVTVVAPGVAVARDVRTDRVRQLAFTRRACELVGESDADIEDAASRLESATLDREGTVAVRARDVRGTADVSTTDAERTLGRVLVERGFGVDLENPDNELRALFSGETCLLGWTAVESLGGFEARKPGNRPFFQPGSMDPREARALVNLAGTTPGSTILDPMCGTGGTLIEAALLGAHAVGLDAQWKMVRGTHENLTALNVEGFDVVRGDATTLPFRDDVADGVVFDAPYGRQSKIARHSLVDLVGGALAEARRVAPRGVLVADRSWATLAEAAGWEVESVFERRVHRSLTRYVHVMH